MIERVAISDIRIGERRRQDLGDIASLAKNIETHGLLHPIIIAADNELIAGERRLRAHEHLGLDTILVRRWPDLTEEERREIELAENLDRKDLTPYERSRNVVALVEVAAEVDKADFRTNSVRNDGPGRPTEPGSLRRVSERTGVPVNTIKTARQHVAAVETYPELVNEPQSVAIAAAKAVTALPQEERPAAIREFVAAPDIHDVAFQISDDAGKSELARLRYTGRLMDRLRPLSKVASEFEAEDVAAMIDDEFYRDSIERPLKVATAWAERVRAAMPTGLRVVQGGRG